MAFARFWPHRSDAATYVRDAAHVVLGAGFAGHTAALHLSYLVKGRAEITVVAPRNRFTWFPSLIWVGTGTSAGRRSPLCAGTRL